MKLTFDSEMEDAHSMLRDNKKHKQTTDTLIGQGSVIDGKLDCESNLRIEGKFKGEIHCKGQVIIGETGEANSNIHGTDIVVAGIVIGDITTKGRLTITSSGEVKGNVSVAKLIIAEGGLLIGTSTMEKAASPLPIKEKASKSAQPEAG
ncbi:Polymer-forming cytoskeletal [compost metagenome]